MKEQLLEEYVKYHLCGKKIEELDPELQAVLNSPSTIDEILLVVQFAQDDEFKYSDENCLKYWNALNSIMKIINEKARNW